MSNLTMANETGMPLLVTAAIARDSKGRILITRRPDHKRHAGFWEFPGGKIDPGESPQDALCREIREELGAEVIVQQIFDVVYYRYDWGAVLLLAYLCRFAKPALRNIGVAEHRWVTPGELSAFPILPADQPIINRLQDT